MQYLLVVDDDKVICDNIHSKLCRLGYDRQFSILLATSATDALILADRYLPEIIITDIHMNAISGLGLIERLRQKQCSAKIFVLSGYDDYEYVRKAFLLGVVDYMLKPLAIGELDRKLKSVLSGQSPPAVPAEEGCDTIEAAIRLIDENLNQNVSMKEVADAMGISYFYFSKLFKQKTGRNFVEFTHLRRIELAKQYLRDPEFTIGEIGYKLGYETPKQFSRAFTRYCGCPPSMYRSGGAPGESEDDASGRLGKENEA